MTVQALIEECERLKRDVRFKSKHRDTWRLVVAILRDYKQCLKEAGRLGTREGGARRPPQNDPVGES